MIIVKNDRAMRIAKRYAALAKRVDVWKEPHTFNMLIDRATHWKHIASKAEVGVAA